LLALLTLSLPLSMRRLAIYPIGRQQSTTTTTMAPYRLMYRTLTEQEALGMTMQASSIFGEPGHCWITVPTERTVHMDGYSHK